MEKFSFLKFIKGFNVFDGVTRAKLSYYAILIALGGFVLWAAFIKPTKQDVQTVSQKMDFQGATIEHLQMTTAERAQPAEKLWSVGIYVETRVQDAQDVTLGARLDRRF